MGGRGFLVGALSAVVLLAGGATAQAGPRHAASRDLSGLWTNATLTPLERPPGFDGLTTTEAAAARFEKLRPAEFLASGSEGVGARESEFWELGTRMTRVRGEIRTSLIIDPSDGKLPYSEAGRRLLATAQAGMLGRAEGPEIRPSPERCLTGGGGASGVPMFAANYNTNYLFVQTARHLAIWSEMGGSVRIIPLAKGPGLPAHIRLWMGTSTTHWEGDTLVVETRNFNPAESHKIPAPIYLSQDAVVTERFTRLSPTEILYAFGVDDPGAFTRPWRGEEVFRASRGPIYESACHEGNYSLPGILAGARREELVGQGTKAGAAR